MGIFAILLLTVLVTLNPAAAHATGVKFSVNSSSQSDRSDHRSDSGPGRSARGGGADVPVASDRLGAAASVEDGDGVGGGRYCGADVGPASGCSAV